MEAGGLEWMQKAAGEAEEVPALQNLHLPIPIPYTGVTESKRR